jgi:CHAT domain-containing protein/tetratricopeptide (TPR) repeat protein
MESILAENIGICLINSGDTSEAKNQLNRSLQIAIEINDEFGIISVLSALGELHYSTGNIEGAISNTRNAIKTGTQMTGIDRRELAKMHFRLGQYLYETDSFDIAIEQFDKMMDVLSVYVNDNNFNLKENYDPWIMMALKFKANCLDGKYTAENNPVFLHEAYSYYRKASWIASVLRRSYNTNVSKLFLSEQTHDLYKSAVNNCFELYQLSGDTAILFEALDYSEQNKYQLMFEQMTSNPVMDTLQINSGVLDSMVELNIELASIERDISMLEQRGKDTRMDSLEILKSHYRRAGEQKVKILDNLKINNPGLDMQFEPGKRMRPADISYYFEQNTDDELWVEFLTTDSVQFVFFIDNDGIKLNRYDVNEILPLLDYIIKNISVQPEFDSDTISVKRLLTSLNSVYNIIFKDELENSKHQYSHIVVIPDHIWTYFPIESLITSYNITNKWFIPDLYLVNNYSVSYSGSLALLNHNNAGDEMLLNDYAGFAPEFATMKGNNLLSDMLNPLIYNSEEISKASKVLGGKIFTGAEADLENFKNEIYNNKIIHLATHSYYDSLVPMNSSLFFSDTVIHLYEICQMHIPADLMILNACNTGIGKQYRGEGPMSISNGFLQSGSRSCIMNLWSVNDFSTSSIIGFFVNHLSNDNQVSNSLRLAKIEYLNNNRKLYYHPYYWASNVVSGKYNQVEIYTENIGRIVVLVSVVLTLLMVVLLFRKWFKV